MDPKSYPVCFYRLKKRKGLDNKWEINPKNISWRKFLSYWWTQLPNWWSQTGNEILKISWYFNEQSGNCVRPWIHVDSVQNCIYCWNMDKDNNNKEDKGKGIQSFSQVDLVLKFLPTTLAVWLSLLTALNHIFESHHLVCPRYYSHALHLLLISFIMCHDLLVSMIKILMWKRL